MNMIKLAIIGFILLESTNILALYFAPGSKKANSVGVFSAWENSRQDPEFRDFAQYMVNWVAGTKLIFILLLVVILLTADETTLTYTGIALMVAIASFYWRLFPLIRRMDRAGEIVPRGYSTALGWMIGAFIIIVGVAVIVANVG